MNQHPASIHLLAGDKMPFTPRSGIRAVGKFIREINGYDITTVYPLDDGIFVLDHNDFTGLLVYDSKTGEMKPKTDEPYVEAVNKLAESGAEYTVECENPAACRPGCGCGCMVDREWGEVVPEGTKYCGTKHCEIKKTKTRPPSN